MPRGVWNLPRPGIEPMSPVLSGEFSSTVPRGKPCLSVLIFIWAPLVAQLGKNLPAMWETWVRSLGWEDSPGEGKGYPFQYSGLENPTDYIVHGVTKSRIWLHWVSVVAREIFDVISVVF